MHASSAGPPHSQGGLYGGARIEGFLILILLSRNRQIPGLATGAVGHSLFYSRRKWILSTSGPICRYHRAKRKMGSKVGSKVKIPFDFFLDSQKTEEVFLPKSYVPSG